MESSKPSDGVQPSPENIARSGIQDLPTELLITIISLASNMESDNLTRAQWLSTVCSRWRAVVEETPEIWSQITGSDPPEIVEKAIEKSKDMSLDIDYYTKAHHTIHRPEDFLQALCPHIHRWRRASIVLTTCNHEVLRGLTIGTAPRLESLTLRASYYYGQPLNLFGGVSPPCLREFHVRRVPLSWDGKHFSNLQKLSIGADRQWTLPLQRVLSILRMTSKLEELTYGGGLSLALSGDNGTMAQGSILLPEVKRLQLYSESSGALEILNYIRVPACLNVSLSAVLGDLEDPENSTQMYEGMIQFLPRITTLKNEGNRVKITARPQAAYFSISTVEFDLFHPTQIGKVLKWMIKDLTGESMEINLSIEDSSFTAEQLDSLVPPSLHRRVSKLSIGSLGNEIHQAGSILEYLSKPKLESDGQVRWPLPHLRELAVLNRSPDLLGALCLLKARAKVIDSPASFRPPQVLKLVLEGGIIDSQGNADLISRINEFLQENGGELWSRDWGKDPVRHFFSSERPC
ncbi:hypothetical protein FS837_001206 [Tulasnella sp. UAMH 9824]|nr:hypothetical protein FS837_001206 [Tulasnella sp. UAMH 9824]